MYKTVSEKTSSAIDKAVHDLIKNAYKRTLDIMKKHQDKIKALSDKLLDKETMVFSEVKKVWGDEVLDIE